MKIIIKQNMVSVQILMRLKGLLKKYKLPDEGNSMTIMPKEDIYRHGDLLLKRVEAIPADATQLNTLTLAEGEATGHHHTFTKGSVVLHAPANVTDDVQKYIEVKTKSAELTHQEHSKIDVGQGVYALSIEREYSPVDKVIRTVLD
jgi:hypothetical protein